MTCIFTSASLSSPRFSQRRRRLSSAPTRSPRRCCRRIRSRQHCRISTPPSVPSFVKCSSTNTRSKYVLLVVVWLFGCLLFGWLLEFVIVLLWFLFLLFLSPVAVEPRGVEGNRQLGAEPHFPRSLCRQVCRHTRPLARLLPHVRSSLFHP